MKRLARLLGAERKTRRSFFISLSFPNSWTINIHADTGRDLTPHGVVKSTASGDFARPIYSRADIRLD